MEDTNGQHGPFNDSGTNHTSNITAIPIPNRDGGSVVIQIRDSHSDIATAIIHILDGRTNFCLFADRTIRPFFAHTGERQVSVTFLQKVIEMQGKICSILIDTSQGAI